MPKKQLLMHFFAAFLVVLQVIMLNKILEYPKNKLTEEYDQKFMATKILELGIAKLQRIWREGEHGELWLNKKLLCVNELGLPENVGSGYLNCNPGLIQCLFENKHRLEVEYLGKSYHIKLKKQYSQKRGSFYKLVNKYDKKISAAAIDGIEVDLFIEELSDWSLKVQLLNSCSSAYLPQRIYSLGKKKAKMWLWDNFNRHIYIDRFLVTNRDILEWINHGKGPKKLLAKAKVKKMALPATHLNAEEMRMYCAFRGKRIMSAHFFDAATFHPGNYKNSKSNIFPKGPYPWGIRKKVGFLYNSKLLKGNGEIYRPKENECHKVYTSECKEVTPFISNSRRSTSWIGIYQVMGGHFEYLENIVVPNENLKLSSFYFPSHSSFHELGVRGFWDGKGFSANNFGKKITDIDESYGVSFRCFRENFNDKKLTINY